jgi:hypothetical protein
LRAGTGAVEGDGRAQDGRDPCRVAADDAEQQVLAPDRSRTKGGGLLAREVDGGARFRGHDDPTARGATRRPGVGQLDPHQVAIAPVGRLARDAERLPDRAERPARVEQAGDLEALEGHKLLAQGRHGSERRGRLGGAHRVLGQIVQALRHAGHALRPTPAEVASCRVDNLRFTSSRCGHWTTMSHEELDEMAGEELPERAATSPVNASVAIPIDAAVAADVLSDDTVADADAAQQTPIDAEPALTEGRGG